MAMMYGFEIDVIEMGKKIKEGIADSLMVEVKKSNCLGYHLTNRRTSQMWFNTEKERNYCLQIAIILGFRTARIVRTIDV